MATFRTSTLCCRRPNPQQRGMLRGHHGAFKKISGMKTNLHLVRSFWLRFNFSNGHLYSEGISGSSSLCGNEERPGEGLKVDIYRKGKRGKVSVLDGKMKFVIASGRTEIEAIIEAQKQMEKMLENFYVRLKWVRPSVCILTEIACKQGAVIEDVLSECHHF